MATVYKYEETKSDGKVTLGVQFLSASTTNRLLFNDPPVALTNTAYTTAVFFPTTGGHEGSGAGKIVFDNAYSGARFFIIDNDDRFSWSTILTGVASNNLLNPIVALTGATFTNTTSGAGYTSIPSVVVSPNGYSVLSAFNGTAVMHQLGTTGVSGVTAINVNNKGLYIPGWNLSYPTIALVGGNPTSQATCVAILSSGIRQDQPILSLSANGNNAWGPTDSRLRLLGYF